MKLTFMGLSAQFYADNFDELRALETTFSDKGKSEENILNPLIEMLQPGDVAYDIGANIGVHTIFMAKKIGVTGKIISFEPDNEAYQVLKQNIRINQLNNVRPLSIALGNDAKKMTLYNRPNIGIGSSSLLEAPDAKIKQYVDVFRGDNVVRKDNLKLPRAVKIDVEGFEYEVIKGLKKTMSNNRCRLLCCEIHPNCLPKDITSEKVFELIKSMGFINIKGYSRGGEIHAICRKP